MNNTLRNLTLSAAALAALTVIAPKASADDRGRGRGFNAPRQELREHGRREIHGNTYGRGYGYGYRNEYGHGYGWRGPGRYYVAPRPVFRYGYASPFRVFSGFRFYSYCPGPGYVYIANYGWVFPPFLGAVWVPGHYDIDGFWIEGFWR